MYCSMTRYLIKIAFACQQFLVVVSFKNICTIYHATATKA